MFVHRKRDLALGLSTSGREGWLEGRKKEKELERRERDVKKQWKRKIHRLHLERSGAAAR